MDTWNRSATGCRRRHSGFRRNDTEARVNRTRGRDAHCSGPSSPSRDSGLCRWGERAMVEIRLLAHVNQEIMHQLRGVPERMPDRSDRRAEEKSEGQGVRRQMHRMSQLLGHLPGGRDHHGPTEGTAEAGRSADGCGRGEDKRALHQGEPASPPMALHLQHHTRKGRSRRCLDGGEVTRGDFPDDGSAFGMHRVLPSADAEIVEGSRSESRATERVPVVRHDPDMLGRDGGDYKEIPRAFHR